MVGDDGAALVVDPALTASEVAGLSAAVAQRGWRPRAVWSTHAHWDHVLDGPGLRGLPRWRGGPARTVDTGWRSRTEAERDADPELARHLSTHEDAAPDVVVEAPLPYPRAADGRIDWSGPTLVVVDHTAHAPDHGALVVVDAHVLVCGDMLSDREVPLLDTGAPDPLARYTAGLDALERAVAEHAVDVVVPGHGTPVDGDGVRRRLDADRAYLDALRTGAAATDPRLSDPQVAAVHDAQVAALDGHREP